MNIRRSLFDAIQRISGARQITMASMLMPLSVEGVKRYEGVFEDYELRMTKGLVDDGIAADPRYRVTGGVSV